MHLLACPLPVTVAVHIRVGSREQIRARQRRRWKRLSASIDYKHRRAHLVGSEEHEALAEAELLDSELAGEIGATVYKVSISVAIRDPRGQADAFESLVKATAREFQAHTGARVIRGRWLSLPGFTTTIPLGIDALRATRSYAQRNIAHCLPLTSSSCGSPDGLILGFADPGGTLERINPFDRLYTRHVTLAIGPSGGGKTVTINALLERAISQGMRGWIVDRSSTAADGGGRSSGHYDMLLGLIPGSARVQVGSGRRRRDLPVGRRRPRPGAAGEGAVPARAARPADRRPARRRGPHAERARGVAAALRDRRRLRALRPHWRAAARDAAARSAPGTQQPGRTDRARRRHAAVADRPARALQRLRRVRPPHRRADHGFPRGDADPVRHRRAPGPARAANDPGDRRPHRGTGPARPFTTAPRARTASPADGQAGCSSSSRRAGS